MDDPAPTFKFLNLPAEVRVLIYRLLLEGRFMIITNEFYEFVETKRKQEEISEVEGDELYLPDDCVKWSGGWSINSQIRNVSILKTSRQLHQEAAPILYSSKFGLERYALFNKFVDSIGTMRSYVKHMHLIPGWDWTNKHTRARTLQLSGLTSLRTLSIYCGSDESRLREINLDVLVANIATSLRPSRGVKTERGDQADRILDLVLFMGEHTGEAVPEYCKSMTVQVRSMLQAALRNDE